MRYAVTAWELSLYQSGDTGTGYLVQTFRVLRVIHRDMIVLGHDDRQPVSFLKLRHRLEYEGLRLERIAFAVGPLEISDLEATVAAAMFASKSAEMGVP